MRNNKLFKKTVRASIALSVFAMVVASTPALVYAEETKVEEEVASSIEEAPSNEEPPSIEEAPSNEDIASDEETQSDRHDPFNTLRRWFKAHYFENASEPEPEAQPETHSEAQTQTEPYAPESLISTYTEDIFAATKEVALTEEDTVQNDQAAEEASLSDYEDQLDALIREIVEANTEAQQTGVQKTVYCNEVTTLTLSVMKALRTCPNVTLDMTYTYNGVTYHSSISGGEAVEYDETISCYGPLWLFTNYGVK